MKTLLLIALAACSTKPSQSKWDRATYGEPGHVIPHGLPPSPYGNPTATGTCHVGEFIVASHDVWGCDASPAFKLAMAAL